MPSNSPSAIMALGTSIAAVAAFVDHQRPLRSTPSYVLARVSAEDGRRPPRSLTVVPMSRSSASTASTRLRTSSLTSGNLSGPIASSTRPRNKTTSCWRAVTIRRWAPHLRR
eukprot:4711673-Pleurochrysis_carterae.AAC.1